MVCGLFPLLPCSHIYIDRTFHIHKLLPASLSRSVHSFFSARVSPCAPMPLVGPAAAVHSPAPHWKHHTVELLPWLDQNSVGLELYKSGSLVVSLLCHVLLTSSTLCLCVLAVAVAQKLLIVVAGILRGTEPYPAAVVEIKDW